MNNSPDLSQQSPEPTEPKESDVLKVSGIIEDFKNIRMGFGQFHFTLELKQDVVGGSTALQAELEKLGAERRYGGTIKVASEGGAAHFPNPLVKGIYYCRYWKGRKGIHAQVQEQSEKDAEDKLEKKILP